MQYNEQCDQFLAGAAGVVPSGAATTTQKLVSLLPSSVEAIRENAMTFLTSATFQANNRDAVREEGLIPVFLEQLQSPILTMQKNASFAIMSISNHDPNRAPMRELGGLPVIFKVLKDLPHPAIDIPKNLITAIALLASNEQNREVMGQVDNLRVLLEFADKRADPLYTDKVLSTIFNLSVGKNNKETIREAGGIPIVIQAMQKEESRETATKILYNLTGVEANREAMRRDGALPVLIDQLLLPLPAKEATVLVALRTLSNLAVDKATSDLLLKNDLYDPLVKMLSSSSQNCVAQTLTCLQNVINDEPSIESLVKHGALQEAIKLAGTNPGLIPKVSVLFSQLLVAEEAQQHFIEYGSRDFCTALLALNDPELHKNASRAIANATEFYDDVRGAVGELAIKKLVQILAASTDREMIRQCCRALINVSLNNANAEIVYKSGVLPAVMQILRSQEKELGILASMILVNLTKSDLVLPLISDKGVIPEAMRLLTQADPDFQLQGAKILTNLAVSGRNRKTMFETRLVAQVRKLVVTSETTKFQLEIAMNNLSFPYEQNYDNLDFKLEDKMPLPKEEYVSEEDEEEEGADERLQQLEEEKKALASEKLKIEEQKIEIEKQRKIAEEKRLIAEKLEQERLANKKKEEEERLLKKQQEEAQRLEKKRQEEEERLKKREEEEKKLQEESEAKRKRKQEKRERKEREQAEEARKEEAKKEEAKKEEERKREEEARKKEEERKRQSDIEAAKALEGKEVDEKLRREKAARKEERRLVREERTKRRAEREKHSLLKQKKKEEKEKKRRKKAQRRARKAEREAAKQLKLLEEREQREKEERERREKEEKEEKERREREEREEKERREKEEREEKERKAKEEREAKEKKEREEAALAALRKMEEEVKKKEEEMKIEAQKNLEKEKANAQQELEAKDQKRTKIAQEILQVERGYCQSLGIIIRKYLNPLTSLASSKKPIIPNDKIKSLFSIVETIYNYNSTLLDGIETRMKRWVADEKATPLLIGDIFSKMTDYMTCYSTYINNYNHAMSTLSELKKTNPPFVQFVRKVETDPECRLQDLEAFIITPIQQLPRYIMLLSDLLRNTNKEHPDYPSISLALEKMKKLTDYVNEQKRESELVATIMAIQQKIRGKFPTLLTPHRKFIKEGALAFGENNNIKWKDGYVFLFNDAIVLTLATNKPNDYKYKDQLPLRNSKLEDYKDDQKAKNAFILHATKDEYFGAKTPQEKTVWMDKIKSLLSYT